MMYVRLHRAARADLIEAAVYFESARDGLGHKFLGEYEAALAILLRYPEEGSPRRPGVRLQRISGFPFDIVYRVNGDELFVVAIADQRQRPRWRNRR